MGHLRNLWNWFADRLGLSSLEGPLKHPVPPETTEGKGAWLYIFGLGILFSFLLQVFTGTILATKYVPSTDAAYQSLEYINDDVVFGSTLRAMHYFGASAMVVLVAIHMARVFLTGSYKFPREFNWLTGVALLVLTLGMAFTGQLLRWDQDGVWTVVVGAYFAGRVPLIGDRLAQFMLAGETLSGATLSRFFAFHVFLLPILIVALVGLHLFLVLHHGISELPRAGQPVDRRTYRERYHALIERYQRPYWPDAAWKEIAFGAVVILTIVALAVIFGPRGLDEPPSLTDLRAEPQPDWFLRWYYTLITIKPSVPEEIFLVYLPLLVLLVLILLPFVANQGERSPKQRPWAIVVVAATAAGLFLLIVLGQRAPWAPDYDTEPLTAEAIGVAEGPVYEGSQLFYEKGCQYCHEVAGRGGDYGPDLTTVAKRISAEEITVRIVQGIGNMPPYRDALTADELNNIVAFLEFLSEADGEIDR